MQISPPLQQPPSPVPAHVTVRPGDAAALRDYDTVSMLLRMPGVESVSYRVPDRDQFTLNMVNPVYAKLASAVLKDTIDGARILFKAEGELPQPPDAGTGHEPWWERRLHMIKAITNLPGVHDFQFVGTRAVAIHAVSEAARAGLQNVLRTELPDAFRTKVHVVVSRTGPEPNAGR